MPNFVTTLSLALLISSPTLDANSETNNLVTEQQKQIIEAKNHDDCTALMTHMEALEQLTKNIPSDFYFYQGSCLYKQFEYSKSLPILENYFITALANDKYYNQALSIFSSAEQKQKSSQQYLIPPPPSNINLTSSNKLQQAKIQTGIDFISVKAGCFIMGSPLSEHERVDIETPHKVCLTKAYALGKYEITQGQWEAVMGKNPSHFEKCGSRCPVENISREDIQIFIDKINKKSVMKFRLPTEAEWEYAARAGTTTAFAFGDNIDTSQSNYDGDHPYTGKVVGLDRKKPVAVGSLPANPWGFHEMHGNVWEFVSDWHNLDYYKHSPTNDPKGPKQGSFHIRRGGSWRFGARFCRSAYRGRFRPDSTSTLLGFRLAATL